MNSESRERYNAVRRESRRRAEEEDRKKAARDKTQVIAEWLNEYEPATYSYDIEADAFRDLTYEQYLQVQEWASEMQTVGEMQDHIKQRLADQAGEHGRDSA